MTKEIPFDPDDNVGMDRPTAIAARYADAKIPKSAPIAKRPTPKEIAYDPDAYRDLGSGIER